MSVVIILSRSKIIFLAGRNDLSVLKPALETSKLQVLDLNNNLIDELSGHSHSNICKGSESVHTLIF